LALNHNRRSKQSGRVSTLYTMIEQDNPLTATMDSRMKPAAAASFAPLEEYTRELTDEVVNTRPAARNPTICDLLVAGSDGPWCCTYSDAIRLLSIRSDRDHDSNDAEECVDHGPPGEVGICLLDVSDYGADEGNQPCEL
jgi:hypothetical protein